MGKWSVIWQGVSILIHTHNVKTGKKLAARFDVPGRALSEYSQCEQFIRMNLFTLCIALFFYSAHDVIILESQTPLDQSKRDVYTVHCILVYDTG